MSDAEKGKVTTAAAVCIALLWAYDLLEPMEDIADPGLDDNFQEFFVNDECYVYIVLPGEAATSRSRRHHCG